MKLLYPNAKVRKKSKVTKLFLYGLHVEGDVGLGAEAVLESVLYFSGTVVGYGEGGGAVHADMCLDGDAVANLTGAQVVGLADIGKGADNLFYLLFGLGG